MTFEEKMDALVISSLITAIRRTPTALDYQLTELIIETKTLVVKYKGEIIKKLKR
ncbi:MAG: hypothetical protein ACPGSD_00020 [Flavobacteriales bacterium]